MKTNKFLNLLIGAAVLVSLPVFARTEHSHHRSHQKYAATNANALPAPSDAAEAQLVKLLSGLNTMQANFAQNSYDIHGKVLQKSSGSMALQRPGKFMWSIQSPNKQLYVADGTYLWTYDVDLAQATKQKLDSSKTNNPASLLSGSTQSLQQRFFVSQLNGNGGQWFALKPKAKNDMFRLIELHFNNNQLDQMKLSDNLGQLSTFTFSNIQMNTNLNASLFQFAPPKAVDVISN